ncbi:hypothetical protein BLOT_009836 [Blomia tropicalis]|nr:hypothetical protein BLOT_009836 [Blomia tropicalis]
MHKLFTNSSLLSEDLSIMEDCKLLGMSLYCRIDEISANLKIMDNVVTKRHLLALIGKCFVSLGRFDPVKLVLRLLVAKTRAIMDLELFKLYECAKIVARIMKYLKYHGLVHRFTDSKMNLDKRKLSSNEFPMWIQPEAIFEGTHLGSGYAKQSPDP